MVLEIAVFSLGILVAGLLVWAFTANFYRKKIEILKDENSALKSQTVSNENMIQQVQIAFSKIAQESLKNQQEQLLAQHSTDLKSKFDLFKSEELNPINRLLKDFKDSIDNYQKSHEKESLDIKNAISTAEKYAKALTTNQNSRGEFGEEWLERVLNFSGLIENVHYQKQFSSGEVKPDFLIKLPDDKHLVLDSKVILKNFIDYCNSEYSDVYKKAFLTDLTNCVNHLAQKNYEEIPNTNQPGFILMFIPIEPCVNMIYSDPEFQKILATANSKNIIIVGLSSLLVALRLVNNLWVSKIRNDNVQSIIEVGAKLYDKIATHSKNLVKIQDAIDEADKIIHTEIKNFAQDKGSIFKQAQKLQSFGIEAKTVKTGKNIKENTICKELLEDDPQSELLLNGMGE